MLSPIDLNNQFLFETGKIKHVLLIGMLSAEFESMKLSAA